MEKETRKDLVKGPDEFVSSIGKLVQFVKSHKKAVLLGTLGILIIIIGAAGFSYWKGSREEIAMMQYFKASSDVKEVEKLATSYSDTKAGKFALLRLVSEAYSKNEYERAIKYAEEFINTWQSKDIFYWEAMMTLARAHIDNGNLEGALPLLEECISTSPEGIKNEALFYKGVVLKELGKKNEALEAFNKISGTYEYLARVYIGDIALMNEGK